MGIITNSLHMTTYEKMEAFLSGEGERVSWVREWLLLLDQGQVRANKLELQVLVKMERPTLFYSLQSNFVLTLRNVIHKLVHSLSDPAFTK